MKMTLDELDIGPPIPYQSPFPTYGSPQAIEQLKGLFKKSPGYLSMLQADAWQSTQRLNNRSWLTSDEIGGAPIVMLREMLPTDILQNADLPATLTEGADLFATAVFSESTDPLKFAKAAANVGLDIATNMAMAIPILGVVFKGFVVVGRFMAKLAKKAEEERAEDVERVMPWISYDKGHDEDIVNLVAKSIIPTSNWTDLWRPPFGTAFSIIDTTLGGKTAAWAPFLGGELPDYTGGIGMLPGMQQGIDIMQCNRTGEGPHSVRDVVTNVADFRPSSLQQAVVSWSMVNNFGSPLMFQVQARALGEQWADWWDDFFGEGIDRIKNSGGGYKDTALAKILARWLCYKTHGNWFVGLAPEFISTAGNLPVFINKDIFSKNKNTLVPGRQYYNPSKLIRKACNDLANAQISALGRTTVSALVRPHATGGRPRFGAFADGGPPMKRLQDQGYNQSNFGQQLRAYADYVRGVLVDHPEKYSLSRRDVMAVDPAYANKLGPIDLPRPEVQPMLAAFPPGGPDTQPPPKPTGPRGNAPFDWGGQSKPPKKKASTKKTFDLAIGVAVVGGGVLAYKYRDELAAGAKTALVKIKKAT